MLDEFLVIVLAGLVVCVGLWVLGDIFAACMCKIAQQNEEGARVGKQRNCAEG